MITQTSTRSRFAAIAFAALVLAVLVAKPSLAYFTDRAAASGGMDISKPSTDIDEKYGNSKKRVVITNDANSVPVYVRVRVYSSLECHVTGDAWYPVDDGWYLYAPVLEPGQATTELTASIVFPVPNYNEGGDHDDDPQPGDQYNIVVVYEAEPVTYDASGHELPSSWSSKGGE